VNLQILINSFNFSSHTKNIFMNDVGDFVFLKFVILIN